LKNKKTHPPHSKHVSNIAFFCFFCFFGSNQVGNQESDVRIRAQFEADDAMMAATHAETMEALGKSPLGARGNVSNASSVHLTKIVWKGKLDAVAQEIEEKKVSLLASVEAMADSIKKHFTDGTEEEASGLSQEMNAKHTAAAEDLGKEIPGAVSVLRDSLAACTSTAAVMTWRLDFEKFKKNWAKNTNIKAFNTFATGLKLQLSKLTRQRNSEEAMAAMNAAGIVHALKPPQWSILMGYDKDMAACSESVFEAKGGLKAAALKLLVGAQVHKITDLPVYKKASRELQKHIASGHAHGVYDMKQPLQLKKFVKIIREMCPADLFSRLPLPEDEWGQRIFRPEMGRTGSAYINFGWTDFAVMEARVFVSGKHVIAGVRTERIPGEDLAEKRKIMSEMPADNLRALIADGGFFWRFDEDEAEQNGQRLIVIPTGFFILQAAEGSSFVRWGLTADDRDIGRTKLALQQMTQAFPELRDRKTGYLSFLEFLEHNH
jgi:hypothetical protein